jgi:biotin transport system substrate-specific component
MRGSLVAAPARPQARIAQMAQLALACTFFAALVAVFARISVPLPFTPVPFTLQPMAIMLTGLFLGRGPAFFALLEYLAAGACGAPIFAGGNGGLPYILATSTLGYLLSYPIAAYCVGWVAERSGLRYARLLGAALVGLAVIYLGGNLYLSFWLHKGALQTLLLGAVPFIVFDVVKAALAAGVASTTAGSWFAWARR